MIIFQFCMTVFLAIYEIYKYMYRDKGEGLKNRDRLREMYETNKEKPEINTRKDIDNSVGRVFGL